MKSAIPFEGMKAKLDLELVLCSAFKQLLLALALLAPTFSYVSIAPWKIFLSPTRSQNN